MAARLVRNGLQTTMQPIMTAMCPSCDSRADFGPGDVLFVPAGVTHRFENFTADLTVWVVFYGPEGGEGE